MDDDRRSRCPACAAPLGLRGSAPWAGPDKRGRTYFECPSCLLLIIDPAFIVDEPSQRARYLLHRNALGDPGYRSVLSAFLDFALPGRVAAPARVLDYGSGPEPALAGLLAERGYEVSSWDPFFMPDRAGIRGPYGAVLLHEVLEHCASPLAALRDAASLVARGACWRNPPDSGRVNPNPSFGGGTASTSRTSRSWTRVALPSSRASPDWSR